MELRYFQELWQWCQFKHLNICLNNSLVSLHCCLCSSESERPGPLCDVQRTGWRCCVASSSWPAPSPRALPGTFALLHNYLLPLFFQQERSCGRAIRITSRCYWTYGAPCGASHQVRGAHSERLTSAAGRLTSRKPPCVSLQQLLCTLELLHSWRLPPAPAWAASGA